MVSQYRTPATSSVTSVSSEKRLYKSSPSRVIHPKRKCFGESPSRQFPDVEHASDGGQGMHLLSVPPTVHQTTLNGSVRVALSLAQKCDLIARLIPYDDAVNMGQEGLDHMCMLEHSLCVKGGPEATAVENHLTSVSSRRQIITWMSHVSNALNWTVPSLQGAILAFDVYLKLVSHEVPTKELGKIAAVSLYYSAQMQETAVDEGVRTLECFRNICPEIGSSSSFMDHQVHLVDTLQGSNFCRKTPFDFFNIYLARMQFSSGCFGISLFKCILKQKLLALISDCIHVSTLLYYSWGVSSYIKGSLWTAISLYHIIDNLLIKVDGFADEWIELMGISKSTVSSMSAEKKRVVATNVLHEVILEVSSCCCADNLQRSLKPYKIRQTDFKNLVDISRNYYVKLVNVMIGTPRKLDLPMHAVDNIGLHQSYFKIGSSGVPVGGAPLNHDSFSLRHVKPYALWIHDHPGSLMTHLDKSVQKELTAITSYCRDYVFTPPVDTSQPDLCNRPAPGGRSSMSYKFGTVEIAANICSAPVRVRTHTGGVSTVEG